MHTFALRRGVCPLPSPSGGSAYREGMRLLLTTAECWDRLRVDPSFSYTLPTLLQASAFGAGLFCCPAAGLCAGRAARPGTQGQASAPGRAAAGEAGGRAVRCAAKQAFSEIAIERSKVAISRGSTPLNDCLAQPGPLPAACGGSGGVPVAAALGPAPAAQQGKIAAFWRRGKGRASVAAQPSRPRPFPSPRRFFQAVSRRQASG